MSNRGQLFTSRFQSSLCSFLKIKSCLPISFYLQINRQTKCQNSPIKTYLKAFVNFKQNEQAKFLSMAKFAYNNIKTASIGHIFFELNYYYHLWILYKDDVNLQSKSNSADKLLAQVKKPMIVCCKNFYLAKERQKCADKKYFKPRTYVSNNKIWLNSKQYIKTKQNWKLKAKLFGPFQVLNPLEKQAYKLELLRKDKIYDVFYMSLLEWHTTKKE